MQDVLKNAPKLYPEDKFLSHIVKNPECYNKFELHKGILWTWNCQGECVICIPKGMVEGKMLRGSLLDACHRTLGHLGPQKMLEYVRRWFWRPLIAKDVEDFYKSCGPCQASKPSRERPLGWVHTMPIPGRPWESVGMDFSGPYPEIKGFNYILLVICCMTGMVHIIPTWTDITAKQVAELCQRNCKTPWYSRVCSIRSWCKIHVAILDWIKLIVRTMTFNVIHLSSADQQVFRTRDPDNVPDLARSSPGLWRKLGGPTTTCRICNEFCSSWVNGLHAVRTELRLVTKDDKRD